MYSMYSVFKMLHKSKTKSRGSPCEVVEGEHVLHLQMKKCIIEKRVCGRTRCLHFHLVLGSHFYGQCAYDPQITKRGSSSGGGCLGGSGDCLKSDRRVKQTRVQSVVIGSA